jgi:phosphate transport system permease protein
MNRNPPVSGPFHPAASQPPGASQRRVGSTDGLTGHGGRFGDRAFSVGTLALALAILALVAALLISMLLRAAPAFERFGLAFVWTSNWNPVTEDFGALPAIFGTMASSLLALLIAVPLGLGSAIFLVELAPDWLARPLSLLIELLAAIPSVVIGLWGILVMVPALDPIETRLGDTLGFIPIFSGAPLGFGLLAAGLVLAVMVLPILTAVIRDVLQAVPQAQREAMLALGATQWETIVRAVLPYGQSGIVGAIILALGRALGETLAVTMVIGNTYSISPSVFAPATTLASLVASQFREADSALYLSALIAAGVVLFAIAVVVNVLARLLVWRVSSRPVGATAGGA